MKAITYDKYGSVDNLALTKEDKPTAKDDEVLIKVKAASINSWDWDLVQGKPLIYRLLFGVLKPKHPIIGIDVSGTVESVGNQVRDLQVGDDVYGDISASGFGAFAEYVCASEKFLAPKPANLSFAEAAAIPHGGVLALQSIESNGAIESGQKILINGAGGSTGPFALQIAKNLGAIVTCVDRKEKLDMLAALGADHLIDYKREDFVKTSDKYNLIIDLMARHSTSEYLRILQPQGALCIVGGDVSKIIKTALSGKIVARYSGKTISVLAHKPGRESLERLTDLFEEGKLKTVIDKIYPLEHVPQALQRLGEGRSIGKLVISVSE